MSAFKFSLKSFLLLQLLMAIGCGDDATVMPEPPKESAVPGDVADLAITTITDSSATLTWTAPGDDGTTGTATKYDIRYSTSMITDANFLSATQAANLLPPDTAGTTETFTVTGISGITTYHFALKTADEVPNWSGISNVPIATTPARFLLKWDSGATLPSYIAVDPLSNNVYVVNSYYHRIEMFDSSGTFLSNWGSQGTGRGQFEYPSGIAINDGFGNLYVTDTGNHRVQHFDLTGEFVLTVWGSQGTGDSEFNAPLGIAAHNFNVYVVDRDNWRIQKFDSDGRFLTKWGSRGTGDGEFTSPLGIAIDGSGNVYVTEQSHRIQKFDSDGKFLDKWGAYGAGDGEFNQPWDISIAGGGNVYVTDRGNGRIQAFDGVGNYLTQWGTLGAGDGQFQHPLGIATDSSGNIYVVDSQDGRVQKFR